MANLLHIDNDVTESVNISFNSYSNNYNYIRDSKNNEFPLLPCLFNVTFDVSYSVPTLYVNKNRYSKSHLSTDNLSLYPIAVRHVSKNNTYVIERPPFKIPVDFKNARAAVEYSKIEPVEIWIPWTVMILPMNQIIAGDPNSLKLYFNDGPIQSIDDYVISSYLPNSYTNGRICWSNSFNELLSQLELSGPNSIDINYLYSSIINEYMMGGWNTDLNFTYQQLLQYHANRFISHANNAKKYPMLAAFTNTANTNPELAEKMKQVLHGKFGYHKRRASTIVSDAVLKDSNNNISSRDIFMKLFAFMSCISLSDTLAFVSNIKNYQSHLNTNIGNKYCLSNYVSLARDNDYYSSSSEQVSLQNLFAPMQQTINDRALDCDYVSYKAVLVYKTDQVTSTNSYISYALRSGTQFESIALSMLSDQQLFSVADIYNTCKNYYSIDSNKDKVPVIVLDSATALISVHDQEWLKSFIEPLIENYQDNSKLKKEFLSYMNTCTAGHTGVYNA